MSFNELTRVRGLGIVLVSPWYRFGVALVSVWYRLGIALVNYKLLGAHYGTRIHLPFSKPTGMIANTQDAPENN
jgi:hypothetical protein